MCLGPRRFQSTVRVSPRVSAILIVAVVGAASCAQPTRAPCELSAAETRQLLALEPSDFDQQRGRGWRALADQGCFCAAAEMIDAYMEQGAGQLNEEQQRLFRWHAGQMYAYAGSTALARERMLAALDPTEPDPPFFPWNDYVRATIAFLDGDRARLEHHRGRIARTVSKGNLAIVDALLERFGQPYATASPYAP